MNPKEEKREPPSNDPLTEKSEHPERLDRDSARIAPPCWRTELCRKETP